MCGFLCILCVTQEFDIQNKQKGLFPTIKNIKSVFINCENSSKVCHSWYKPHPHYNIMSGYLILFTDSFLATTDYGKSLSEYQRVHCHAQPKLKAQPS